MEVNKISTDTQKSIRTRVLTGIVLFAIAVPCIVLGNWFFVVLAAFIAGVSVWEILHVTGKKYPWYVWVTTYIFVYSFTFWVFFQQGTAKYDPASASFSMWDIRISTMGVAFLIALLFFYSILSEKVDTKDVFFIFTMSLFIGIAIQSILFLRFCPQALAEEEFLYTSPYATCLLIVYVLLGTCFNDIFAYFVGILFGKHKMAPRVSPKKTWEGFFGGVLLSAVITVGVALLCDLAFHTPILHGILDAEHWYFLILTSLGIGLSSVLGDLMFSLIKRSYNIKDFGNIFPGHGGVLDRFDSLLITSFLITILITFIYYQPLWSSI